ncbi:MAG: amidase family protein, partial [Myxococcota bacterium]
ALVGVRLGVRATDDFDSGTQARFATALADLTALGAELVAIAPVDPSIARVAQIYELEVLLHEFSGDLEAYLSGVEGLETLQDVVDFNVRHAATELRWFGQDLFERALARRGGDEAAYRAARETSRRTFAGFVDGRVAEHDLQAIVTPTAGPAFPIDLVHGDGHSGSSSHLTAVSGYPAVTVPMGVVEDLPVGLSFIGPAFTDGRLLAYAYAYERATRRRPVPRFLRSVGEAPD